MLALIQPESRTRDLVEKAFGLVPKEFVSNFEMKEGEIELLIYMIQKGKFGRILGDIPNGTSHC